MRKPYKRTRLWVNAAFQSKVLLRLGLHLLLYALIVWCLAFFFAAIRSLMPPAGTEPARSFHAEFLHRQQPFLISLVLVVPLFVYDLIKFSHRIAGPLYRCRRVMRDMASGKVVPEFKPRKHDLMPELFHDFNVLIKAWNARVARDNGLVEEKALAELLSETNLTPEPPSGACDAPETSWSEEGPAQAVVSNGPSPDKATG